VTVQSHEKAKWNLRESKLLKTPTRPFNYAVIQIQSTNDNKSGMNHGDFIAFNSLFQTHVEKIFGTDKAILVNGNRHWRNICTADTSRDNRSVAEQKILVKITEAQSWGAQIIIVILTSKSGRDYSMVKRAGDLVVGVPTVCLQAKNSALRHHQRKDDFIANILLKVNMKLSNENANHTIQSLAVNSIRPKLLETRTLMVGLDVVSCQVST